VFAVLYTDTETDVALTSCSCFPTDGSAGTRGDKPSASPDQQKNAKHERSIVDIAKYT
jgi:hypothetical protein